MSVEQQIEDYVAAQPPKKRGELEAVHRRIRLIAPDCELWFLDGRDATGKVVSNPNVGYGRLRIAYADGTSRPFYRLGLSANTAGISLYVMGMDDRTWLARTYGARLGKVAVTGYCVRFRSLSGVDGEVLDEVIRFALSDRA